MKYVSLHHHTTFSYKDGVGTPEQHVERSAELGMAAQAATEHGNVSSFVRHEQAGQKHGVKPLFGCELYTSGPIPTQRKWHLTVLAENQEGYQNLNHMVSRSWDPGNFYYWPTTNGTLLKEHAEGLVALSGCADSLLSCTWLGGKGVEPHAPDHKAAERVASNFKELFGDRYYIEMQMFPELERTRTLNALNATMAEKLGIPIVATADVHYPNPDDNDLQKVLHAAGRNTGTVAAAEAEWEYNIRLTHPTSDRLVMQRLMATGLTRRQASQALANSAEIAQRCNVVLPKADRLRFPLPDGTPNSTELMWEWLRAGWKYRWPRSARLRSNASQYNEQLKYEVELSRDKDFLDYFLMVSEITQWCKGTSPLPGVKARQGLPISIGPARGSAAASVMVWLLRISEVDPLMFPTMVFERFMDPSRKDMPDIDLDFQDDRRDEVRLHAIDVWGEDRVGNIMNVTRYRGKNSLNDVGRTMFVPKAELKVVSDLIVERSGGDARFDNGLQDTFDMFPKAAEVLARYPQLELATRLEGNMAGMSVHAAGLVIADRPVNEIAATYSKVSGKEKKLVTVLSTDKEDTEYLGMLKVDILGLSTMGMISRCLELIGGGITLDQLYQVPLDDRRTMDAFTRGDVMGIFQFEGRATRVIVNDVKPTTFMELADINALSRPGPLFSGATSDYIDVKRGTKKPRHYHPLVDEITKWSNYQMIYQEQILQTCRRVGMFQWTEAAKIRKIISRKKGEAAFQEYRALFMEGAATHGDISPQLAADIWGLLVTSGAYAFNVAHCISYSMLAFWCQWLKQNYPAEFYAASLSKQEKEDWPRLIRDGQEFGRNIVVKGPSLATLDTTWTSDAKRGEVYGGLSQINGIGEKSAPKIIEEHRREPFTEWSQLQRIPGIGPKTIQTIVASATSPDPYGVHRVEEQLTELRKMLRKESKAWGWPAPSHTSSQMPADMDNTTVVWLGFAKSLNYQDYVEHERSKTGAQPDDILAKMKRPDLMTSCVVRCYDDGEEDVYLRFGRFIYPKFKAALESLHTNTDAVLVRGTKRKGFGITIIAKQLYVLSADSDEETDAGDNDG